jgi:hypothetical protein
VLKSVAHRKDRLDRVDRRGLVTSTYSSFPCFCISVTSYSLPLLILCHPQPFFCVCIWQWDSWNEWPWMWLIDPLITWSKQVVYFKIFLNFILNFFVKIIKIYICRVTSPHRKKIENLAPDQGTWFINNLFFSITCYDNFNQCINANGQQRLPHTQGHTTVKANLTLFLCSQFPKSKLSLSRSLSLSLFMASWHSNKSATTHKQPATATVPELVSSRIPLKSITGYNPSYPTRSIRSVLTIGKINFLC